MGAEVTGVSSGRWLCHGVEPLETRMKSIVRGYRTMVDASTTGAHGEDAVWKNDPRWTLHLRCLGPGLPGLQDSED